VFDNLSDKLQDTFRDLTGRGTLNEKNIKDAMRDIRLALLDADVNYATVKSFIADVEQECLGEKVLRSVSPGQQAVKVVSDKLTELMGESNAPLNLEGFPATIMIVGLHGGGKTTTSAKLAAHLKKQGRHVLLVAADVYRPAAIDQLEFLGQQIGVPVYSDRLATDIAQIAEAGRQKARHDGCNTMIIDTAGRLQIDHDLVQELVQVRDKVEPNEILLVGDAALGQEAVSVAKHFDDALGVSGMVLTKLDGDARGGAALSMRQQTGKPIKFIGVGEKIEDLEPFYPDRMASRILGMGDVVSLVEKAEEAISVEEAKELEEKMLKNRFDFNDFRSSLDQLRKLGGLGSLMNMLPGGRKMLGGMQLDESMFIPVESMISSMTPEERAEPDLLKKDESRRQRIARGSGRDVGEVDGLLQRFGSMKDMMSGYGRQMLGGAPQQRVSQKAKKARRKKGRNKNRRGKRR
jgi:signal recognition particle subunit SRP54